MKNVIIWIKAVVFDYPLWEIEFKNGTKLYPVYSWEADMVISTTGGKKYIKYE